jgi:hypothetical protein
MIIQNATLAAELRFDVLSVKDSDQMIGGEAFHMLIPAGWKSQGGAFWRWHPVMPASVTLHQPKRQFTDRSSFGLFERVGE